MSETGLIFLYLQEGCTYFLAELIESRLKSSRNCIALHRVIESCVGKDLKDY